MKYLLILWEAGVVATVLLFSRVDVRAQTPLTAASQQAARWMAGLPPRQAVAPDEAAAWGEAMQQFAHRADRDDFGPLLQFLEKYPSGAWSTPLRIRLAEELYLTGHYSRTLELLQQAWDSRKDPLGSGIAGVRGGVRLAEYSARLGKREVVEQVLAELKPLQLGAADQEIVRSIEQGLATMRTQPELAFRCGALALERIRVFLKPTDAGHEAVFSSRSTAEGMSLADVAALSEQLGMNYRMAYRPPGAAFVTPCVLHLKVGHYVAVLRERRGWMELADPTGWERTFASRQALDEEGSGYYLVPPGDLPQGWRPVGADEGARVFGRNGILDNDPDACGPRDAKLQCGGSRGRSSAPRPSSFGMATWDVHLMLVSQEIVDTPVGYEPPFGPPVYVTVRRAQRANERFGYRPTWTHNWTSQLFEDPRTPLGDLWLQDDGGWERFEPLDEEGKSYRGHIFNAGRIDRTSSTNLTWTYPDGTRRIYTTFAPTNIVWARSFQLTGVEDASGNRVTVQVLPNGRVESLIDPLGRVTRFYYELPDPGVPISIDPRIDPVLGNTEYPNQLTRVVDPFGRTARFEYVRVERALSGFCDGQTCLFRYYQYDLTNVVDVAGMSSRLSYEPFGAWVSALTTPYGSTQFRWVNPLAGSYAMEITDAMGATERLEFGRSPGSTSSLWQLPTNILAGSVFDSGRTVMHWGKKAYAESYKPGSEKGATLYSFQYSETLAAAGRVLESIQPPLESRVWFNYAEQGSPRLAGLGDQPTRIGRVLDDGRTQLWQFERNAWGSPVRTVDPLGRTFVYRYASNEIDLIEAQMTAEGRSETLMRAAYDHQHQLTEMTDAAGQTTRHSYNARGQILRTVNPLGETTEFTYDANGYLINVDGPLPGTQDRTEYAYDGSGRIRAVTDADGYSVTLEYDALDRVTRIRFPDGTTQDYAYDRLELGRRRDRLGRDTLYAYDATGRLASVQDARGLLTRFEWCGCGQLDAIVDPLGRLTRWHRDLQGRVVAKEYADGSRIECDYERSTSRLKRVRDEQGQITEYDYDLDDALARRSYPNSNRPTPSVAYRYGSDYPRLLSMTDGIGTTTYRYNPITTTPTPGAGRLAAVDGPWANDEVTYGYDALGRVQTLSLGGFAVRSTYDAGGRLLSLTNGLGEFRYTWDGVSGRLTRLDYPNGMRAEYGYHGSARDHLLQRVTHWLASGAKLSEFTYDYDPLHRITNWTQLQNDQLAVWSPTYDEVGRLTSVRASAGASHSFAYDDANNRLLAQSGAERREFQYDALNQLTGFGAGGPDEEAAFEWDAANRLTAITRGSRRTEVAYDGLDRFVRIVEKDHGNVTRERTFLWCGPTLHEERDASGGVVRKRFSSLGVRVEPGAEVAPGNYYYTHDHQRSVREVVDASGAVRARYAYQPYGQRTRLTGDFEADFGFTGHFTHGHSALLLALYRPYDPSLGRWLTRDPRYEHDSLNLYSYSRGDPINAVDPDGLDPRAGQLVSQTTGYQQGKAGLDALDNAKAVGEVVDSVVENGVKKTVKDKAKGKLEDEAKKAFPKGARDEAEKLNEQAGKLGKEAVDPYAKTAFGKAGMDINRALSGDCPNPKPVKLPRAPKAPPPEKSLWESILDLIGMGSDGPPPPPPPPPDGPIPKENFKSPIPAYRPTEY